LPRFQVAVGHAAHVVHLNESDRANSERAQRATFNVNFEALCPILRIGA
jgi:hypothetical protein